MSVTGGERDITLTEEELSAGGQDGKGREESSRPSPEADPQALVTEEGGETQQERGPDEAALEGDVRRARGDCGQAR